MFGRQEAARLLADALVAICDFVEVRFSLIWWTKKGLVQVARDAVSEIERLGFNDFEQPRLLFIAKFVGAKLAV